MYTIVIPIYCTVLIVVLDTTHKESRSMGIQISHARAHASSIGILVRYWSPVAHTCITVLVGIDPVDDRSLRKSGPC